MVLFDPSIKTCTVHDKFESRVAKYPHTYPAYMTYMIVSILLIMILLNYENGVQI